MSQRSTPRKGRGARGGRRGSAPLAAAAAAATAVPAPLELHAATPRQLLNSVLRAVKSGDAVALAQLIAAGAPLNERVAGAFTPLLVAAACDSLHVVKLLLRGGASVTATNGSGETALHVAARKGNTRVAAYLITGGAALTATTLRGDTVLHVAAWRGHDPTVQLLLERGAAVDVRNANGETALHVACFRGEVGVARLLLRAGADTRVRNPHGELPLHIAVFKDSVAIVQLLLEHASGAGLEELNLRGDSPLHVAAKSGYTDIALLLVRVGATMNRPNKSGFLPLHSAAQKEHTAVVRLLLSGGTDPNAVTTPGRATALHFAAASNNLECLHLLIQCGAQIDIANASGETPLQCAVNKSHVGASLILVQHGADVNTANSHGMAPLHQAALRGTASLTALLVERGAFVDAKMPNNQTPLFIAAKNGHYDVAKTLLDAGAAIDVVSTADETPILWAARSGHLDVLQLLLHRGGSIAALPPGNKSALIAAVSNNHVDVVKFLLSEGASVEDTNTHGETPLHLASFKGYTAVVELLIQAGASVGAKNIHGETPLHIAAFKGDVVLAELLISAGAALNSTNEHGDTPLRVAASKSHRDVAQLLLERKSPVCKKNTHGESALHAAAATGSLELVRMLIAAGAPVDTLSRKRRTPLFLAACGGHLATVQFLIEEGASVNMTDATSETPLIGAARSGHFDIVQLLICHGAFVNVRAVGGETLLSLAAHWVRLDMVELLLDNDYSTRSSSTQDQHDGAPRESLISVTLEALQSYSAGAREFWPLYNLVILRLEDFWQQLELRNGLEQSPPTRVITFAKIVYRFILLMKKYESTSVIDRLITSRNVVNSIKDFHMEIDHFVSSIDADCSAPVHSNWMELWHESRLKQFSMFKAVLDKESHVVDFLRSESEQIEAVTLLRYELSCHSHNYSEEKLALMTTLLERLVQASASIATIAEVPSWFLPRHEAATQEVIAGQFPQMYYGNWLNVEVVIYYDYTRDQNKFEEDATVWHQLSHPNVIKLFGACHIGQPRLFVYEHASHWNLRDYLKIDEHRGSMWKRLNEVVLGLQYLHERRVVHGRLRCDNIFIGWDGKARIAGFEKVEKAEKLVVGGKTPLGHGYRWKAPECVRGEQETFESDVYSLGLCICEAVSGEIPWSTESEETVLAIVRRGWPHNRPDGMTWEQWDVVKKTFAFDPRKRAKIGYLVEGLKQLVADERMQRALDQECSQLEADGNAVPALTAPGNQALCKNLAEYLVPELCVTIPEALEKTKAKCLHMSDPQDTAMHVYARLQQLYSQLLAMNKVPGDMEVTRYCTLLTRFQRYVRTPTSDLSAARIAKSRRAADTGHVFHGEIDRMLELLSLSDSSLDPIHEWRQQHPAVGRISSDTSATSSLSSTTPRSERSNNSNSSLDGTLQDVTEDSESESISPTPLAEAATPAWFMPLHELFFDEQNRIGEGSFGAVYRGTWLDTPVVVKFMGYEDDDHDIQRGYGGGGGGISNDANADHGHQRRNNNSNNSNNSSSSSNSSSNKISNSRVLDMFLHEASVWHPLNHPHVVKLFGACHVGKRFFACEFAANGTLRGFLGREENKHLVWRKLYEAALGLQYVHDQSIVHNDLKCDNILVGADGKAKLTDFGLSCTPTRTMALAPREMGALQWKAPEVLVGSGAPSFASDVYSFAMCMIEAVKDDAPWGRRIADAMVRLQARKGNLPPRPARMNEEQWGLVEMMCASDPARRVRVSFVVDKLKEISEAEAAEFARQLELQRKVLAVSEESPEVEVATGCPAP